MLLHTIVKLSHGAAGSTLGHTCLARHVTCLVKVSMLTPAMQTTIRQTYTEVSRGSMTRASKTLGGLLGFQT